MVSSQALPSLLVFGPQNEFPSEEVLEDLRQELVGNPLLSALTKAVDELPQLWGVLISFDKDLSEIPGADYLVQLKCWVQEGGPFPHHQGRPPNLYALAVTFILQISQYARYLRHLGDGSHRRLLESVRTAGIQGFCVGFISAVVVASSQDESEIGAAAAVGLRLAVCIGAYVDLETLRSRDASGASCVAIRFRESYAEELTSVNTGLQSYPGVSPSGLIGLLFA
ncbi:hypothetical protein F5B17DRAFT_256589 [Nemania serpens]|nr:hypothetical protein F5B17DRAFT_256589 [Nemania serpens]